MVDPARFTRVSISTFPPESVGIYKAFVFIYFPLVLLRKAELRSPTNDSCPSATVIE